MWGKTSITGFSTPFENSRHLKKTFKSLHTMKIEIRIFHDISSHPRDCNKPDQTKEVCPRAMLPLWEWAAAPCRVPERMSGSHGLSKLVEGQGRIKDQDVQSLLPQSWASAKDGEMTAAGINQLWVEHCYTQSTPPPHDSLGCYYNSPPIIKYFRALYWLHWDNTTFKAPVPQGRS